MSRRPHKQAPPSEAKLKFNRHNVCPNCFRSAEMCICSSAESFENHIRVIILQHPQEQFKMLNSARLARLILKNSSLRVGLSWPNFKSVAGTQEQPSSWGILYLKNEKDNSTTESDRSPAAPDTHNAPGSQSAKPITITDRKNQIVQDYSFLRGIVAIDGSWKQAKAMWWRNPWFLRLYRISLNPNHPSVRKQVKKAGLSTIEAVALALELLGEDPVMCESMRRQYAELVVKRVEAG